MDAKRQQFESLVEPHFDALYRAAFRLTRNTSDAEDLVQEVCLRAFGEISRIADLDFALGWLLKVQYRLFVDMDRRRRRAPVSSDSNSAVELELRPADCPGPEDLADSRLLRSRLESAWAKLSSEQRALLGLHAEGYTLVELERITNKGRGVLSARLHRARKRLSKLIFAEQATHEHLHPKVTKQ